MRVLIVPEYAAFGGTLTFFLQLLEAHQNANIETAILIQPHQTQPDIMQRIHALGVPLVQPAHVAPHLHNLPPRVLAVGSPARVIRAL